MAINKINSKSIEDLQISADDLANGTVTNAKLANTTITINGTSIDLGSSGDIVAGTDWQAVVVADGSTSTTAVAGEGYFIDTTSNTHTLTLPSSPSIGDTVAIKDYAGTFGTNNLTIGRNGNNIQGVANDSVISTNRASITLVYVDATKGWLYAVESNVANLEAPTFISATGGTVTTSGDYKIHTFTGDGCFVVSVVGVSPSPSVVDYLVVAGGGGGGSGWRSGGGGAGGYREAKTGCAGCYTASPLATPTGITVSATTYPVTVGGGGTGGGPNLACKGTNGSNSVFSTITSTGGGLGGEYSPGCSADHSGSPGGSGGGAGGNNPPSSGVGGSGNTPPVSPPQGNNGGDGNINGSLSRGAGGGGASAAGTPSLPCNQGCGGAGVSSSITASPVAYAGGGGGGCYTSANSPPSGGLGGGGAGGCSPTGGSPGATGGTNGTANTGGGGGGKAGRDDANLSGSGGKGIVIIRYKFQ